MKSILSGFCLVALFASTRSDAQQVVKSGFSLERPATEAASLIYESRAGSQSRFWVLGRTAGGTAGWFLGAIAGGYAGYHILPHHDCGCDDPGLTEFVYGAFAGGAFGAGWGAAAPVLSSECSSGTRVGRSLLGSAAGTAIGLLAFRPSGTQLVAVPLLSISGAVLAQRSC
jgi:hypothetical protein